MSQFSNGLAGAVAADQAEAPAGVQAQPDAAQGVRAAEPLVDPRRAGRRGLGGSRGLPELQAPISVAAATAASAAVVAREGPTPRRLRNLMGTS